MARPLADAHLKRRVVIAVFELVGREGIAGLSMRRVAERTGLSTGTINYHFGNKGNLLVAALDYAYHLPHDWEAHAVSARTALERIFRRYLLQRRPVRAWWHFYCAVAAHAANDRALQRRLAANQQRLVGLFALVLEAGRRRGEVGFDGAAGAEAERLAALAHGLALRQLVEPEARVIAGCAALLEAELDRLCQSRTTVRLSGHDDPGSRRHPRPAPASRLRDRPRPPRPRRVR